MCSVSSPGTIAIDHMLSSQGPVMSCLCERLQKPIGRKLPKTQQQNKKNSKKKNVLQVWQAAAAARNLEKDPAAAVLSNTTTSGITFGETPMRLSALVTH